MTVVREWERLGTASAPLESRPIIFSQQTVKLSVTLETRGRVRNSREQRRQILDEFERSGVSAVEFCPAVLGRIRLWPAGHRHRRSENAEGILILGPLQPTPIFRCSGKIPFHSLNRLMRMLPFQSACRANTPFREFIG